MKTLFICFAFVLLGTISQSYAEKSDTIMFRLTNKVDNYCFQNGVTLEIINSKQQLVSVIETAIPADITIPIEQGIYDVLIKIPNCSCLLLKGIQSRDYYVGVELLCDTIIKDTIVIPFTNYVTVFSNSTPSYVQKGINGEYMRIKKWENPFCLEKIDFNTSDAYCQTKQMPNLECGLFISIKKPKTNIKYLISPSRDENKYLSNSYFEVFAYAEFSNSEACRNNFSNEDMYYSQTIFNIAELYARKLREYLSSHNAFSIYNSRDYVSIKAKYDLNWEITSFKRDTEYGMNKEKVKEWYKKIYFELKQYDKYSYNAEKWYFD